MRSRIMMEEMVPMSSAHLETAFTYGVRTKDPTQCPEWEERSKTHPQVGSIPTPMSTEILTPIPQRQLSQVWPIQPSVSAWAAFSFF